MLLFICKTCVCQGNFAALGTLVNGKLYFPFYLLDNQSEISPTLRFTYLFDCSVSQGYCNRILVFFLCKTFTKLASNKVICFILNTNQLSDYPFGKAMIMMETTLACGSCPDVTCSFCE